MSKPKHISFTRASDTNRTTSKTKATDGTTSKTNAVDRASSKSNSTDRITSKTNTTDRTASKSNATDRTTSKTNGMDTTTSKTNATYRTTSKTNETVGTTSKTNETDRTTSKMKATDGAASKTNATDRTTSKTNATDRTISKANETAGAVSKTVSLTTDGTGKSSTHKKKHLHVIKPLESTIITSATSVYDEHRYDEYEDTDKKKSLLKKLISVKGLTALSTIIWFGSAVVRTWIYVGLLQLHQSRGTIVNTAVTGLVMMAFIPFILGVFFQRYEMMTPFLVAILVDELNHIGWLIGYSMVSSADVKDPTKDFSFFLTLHVTALLYGIVVLSLSILFYWKWFVREEILDIADTPNYPYTRFEVLIK